MDGIIKAINKDRKLWGPVHKIYCLRSHIWESLGMKY